MSCNSSHFPHHSTLGHNSADGRSFGFIQFLIVSRTADVVASSPRFRRKSSTFVDAIHDLPEKGEIAPAQLYSTESGRLFHSGRIVIITVGLPARGKTSVDSIYLVSCRGGLTCFKTYFGGLGTISAMVCIQYPLLLRIKFMSFQVGCENPNFPSRRL